MPEGEEVAGRLKILYVISRRNTFTEIDRGILAQRFDLIEYHQPGARPRPLELVRKVRSCDVVFGWFASWHTLAALAIARLLRKPSVLVIGGFDTARADDIDYGWQRGGLRQFISRRAMHLATRLVTNSRSSLHEVETNVGLDPARVAVIYHGLADRFGEMPPERDRMVLTVGVVRRANLERKGLIPFVGAARLLPDLPFVLAGRWRDDSIDLLRAAAPQNVRLTGFLEDAELDALFRRAAVYVQASRHEGFGLSLAEAMLAGCVPVVTESTALPEVVGDVGIRIAEATPEDVASGVMRALAMGPSEGARARGRILEAFPIEQRAAGLSREVQAAARSERSG